MNKIQKFLNNHKTINAILGFVIRRFWQFGISLIFAFIIYILAVRFGATEMGSGLLSGAGFMFMVSELEKMFC